MSVGACATLSTQDVVCMLVGKEIAEKQGETTVSDWQVRRHCRRVLQKMFYDLNKRAC